MENKDIHNGLPNKGIRDFLSIQLEKSMIASQVKDIEEQIKYLQTQLNLAKIREAVLQLIKNNGWTNFDCSEIVKYNDETYFSFVGTEEEFKKLENKIKKENIYGEP